MFGPTFSNTQTEHTLGTDPFNNISACHALITAFVKNIDTNYQAKYNIVIYNTI